MGDFSYLRFVPASVANIPIDWTRVPEASKKKILEWVYDRPLPTTVADLAKYFDESKFFGYFESDLCTLLMDVSEFGLQPDQFRQVGPRFYMKHLQQVWFLLFTPGKRNCVVGNSEDIIGKEDETIEEEIPAEEVDLAQKFDARLEREVSTGVVMVIITKKLGGWSASMLQDILHISQYNEAILTLPDSHPAKRGFCANMFKFWFDPS